jgi:hypothetical protein
VEKIFPSISLPDFKLRAAAISSGSMIVISLAKLNLCERRLRVFRFQIILCTPIKMELSICFNHYLLVERQCYVGEKPRIVLGNNISIKDSFALS